MLEYDPYYFRGQKLYSVKALSIAIIEKRPKKQERKQTICKKYKDSYNHVLVRSFPLQKISTDFRGIR